MASQSPRTTNNPSSTYFSTEHLPSTYNADPFHHHHHHHSSPPLSPSSLEALPHHTLLDLPANFELDDSLHRPTRADELDEGILYEHFRDFWRLRAVRNLCALVGMTVLVVGVVVGMPIVSFLSRAAA